MSFLEVSLFVVLDFLTASGAVQLLFRSSFCLMFESTVDIKIIL